MPYCPKCKTEYNPGIEKCSDCDLRLVDELPEEPSEEPPEETVEKVEYKLLRNLPGRVYAEMLKESLRNSGIISVIKGDDFYITGGSYSTMSLVEISLWVPKEDWERANQIADEMLDHI